MDLSNFLRGDVYGAGINFAYSAWILKTVFEGNITNHDIDKDGLQAMEHVNAVQKAVSKIEIALVKYEA